MKMTDSHQTARRRAGRAYFEYIAPVCLAALGLACAGPAFAADKPPLNPDPPSPLTTTSRVSATIEFGLPVLASAVERDIPRRLATIDEEVRCVHRRVLGFRVNANCDIYGYIERAGPVSLYGRGDRIIGATRIYGAVEGQGANRFTARIHGETEASATFEAEARPQLRRDWSLDLNFSDGFRWSEPPYLHVLGRDIAVAKYAEPRIRAQLAKVRSRAEAAARQLDLRRGEHRLRIEQVEDRLGHRYRGLIDDVHDHSLHGLTSEWDGHPMARTDPPLQMGGQVVVKKACYGADIYRDLDAEGIGHRGIGPKRISNDVSLEELATLACRSV